ncbi:methyl-accepting chemotaxis sensory transducer with GAF sensor [Cyanobacterium stanieri PCC 7202]|uniref:Methyl-accepting chemotaxis sensory transducer with GAF sensor n=1 Tax=Cyanobacterium stanieri (strain ATCC 29140 / PCC 7202) TaxID=292563 RepID=K9YH33_CYASC|nr:methyl-accepting chemotaxis sensory transducer with GAF sensor [Cyanobacterium stanieri PCC 7202]
MTQTPQKPKLNLDSIPTNNKTRLVVDTPIQNRKAKTVKKESSPLVQWFFDLSLRRKQLLVLLSAQTVAIASLVGVSVTQIISGGRQQLINQSASELEASKINYDIKVNQMGFGFRGQSDNTAIIEAAIAGDDITPEDRAIVRQILANEITARNIEYATLVGLDGRIIVNANNDRTGELFDPNGLVSRVIENPEQIRISELVPWEDLERENPPNLGLFEPGFPALIRYTFTPVFALNTNQVVGVLVSGDVVNGKYTIVEDTVEEFNGGYAAIYKLIEGQEFRLASSLLGIDDTRERDIIMEDETVLNQSLIDPDDIFAERTSIEGEIYTVTAQVIQNSLGDSVGIIVRGTPERDLNSILTNSVTLQIQVAVGVILFSLLLIIILGKAIAQRVESLQGTTEKFMAGDYDVQAQILGDDEIGKLARTFNELATNIANNEGMLLLDNEKGVLLQEITGSRTLDEDDVNKVFDKALIKTKEILKVDRLVIYRFKPDWSGYISNEAGDARFPSALNEKINDPCIPLELRQAYINGRVVPTENVYKAGFAPEHEALMHRLEIKSNLVVPIISQGKLFALLIAHHCQNHHTWGEKEISFMGQIALRFGVILDRVSLLKSQMIAARRAEQLKEITLSIASKTNRAELLDQVVDEIRDALGADRSIVYEFDENWQGTIVAESVDSKYPEALGAVIADPCFADRYVEKYEQGRVQATPNIYEAGLTECHLKQLQPFEVVANLVAPILVDQKLLGLLICHQCSGEREWEAGEIELFSQLSTQVGLGLERVQLLDVQRNSEQEQRQAKELLQKRALDLLMQVDPVSDGDLTIRASVTEDEIGTIADSYNATIESLRKIVSQVQTAANSVTKTTTVNENDVNVLQAEIQEQVLNITQALKTIEAMSNSSSLVAENAEQAEEALQRAQESVEIGEVAMNRTVKSIMEIRSTVQQAAKQMKKLGDTTQNISNVVALIGRFAAQTHLLALKASIEAARAGEQGTGFAVIAEEVRTLATQSASATADIEKLVTEILSETKIVVTAMEQGNEQVVEGSKLVEETRQSLNQITAATSQINELVEAIATAAFEQSENSEDVGEKMTDVAKVAQKTTVSVTKLSDSFRQLLQVARELESNVSQFKVG